MNDMQKQRKRKIQDCNAWKTKSLTFFALFCMASTFQAPALDLGAIRQVTIQNAGISVKEALEQVKAQSGVYILYNEADIDKSLRLKLNLKNVPFKKAMDAICQEAGLAYKVSKNHVLITKADTQQNAQHKTVSGQVLDEAGLPLIGASVRAVGTKFGTVTDVDGRFTLRVPADVKELAVSFIGMKTETVKIDRMGVNALHIVLREDGQQMDEVIVTGYQTISKERATGSFGIISGEQMEAKLQPDLKSVLEGQAAGVVLDKDGNIEIRGVSTFSAEKVPLIVVDGFPAEISLDDLNPENIESITVLKDGVAASIYGSRSANGVIVVETKNGTVGRPRLSYKGTVSIVPKPNLSDLHKSSTSDYIDAEIELFNQDPSAANPMSKSPMNRVTYLLMQARDGVITQDQAMAEIDQLRGINGLKQVGDHMFRNKFAHQHNVSLSGGTEENRYNIAFNLYDAKEHFLHTSENSLKLDMKNEWKPYKWLKINTSVNIKYDRNKEPTVSPETFWNWGHDEGTYMQPYTAIVDDQGRPTDIWGLSTYKINKYESTPGMKAWNYNPIEDLGQDNQSTTDFQVRLSGSIHLDIWKGLNLEVGGNWQRGNTQWKQVRGADCFDVRTTYNDATSVSNPAEHYFPDGALINESRDINENWTVRTQLNFRHDFDGGKHRITALAGNEVRRQTYDNNTMASRAGYNEQAGTFTPVNIKDYNARKYNSDMLMEGNRAISSLEEGSYAYRDNRFVSWYGNGSYEYDNRFIVSGSIRLDLTNFFGTDPKYRYRPLWSVGGTWKLSNEKFFNVPWMNRLYVRASYGINGNISLDEGPFLILRAGSYDYTTGGVAYYIQSPPNNQLRWEKTASTNIGVDMSFLDSRINLSLDYYRKKSTDLFAYEESDPTLGYATLTRNAGAITNNGVEITLDATPVQKKDFTWGVTWNMSFNRNHVDTYNLARNYVSSYATAAPIQVAGYPSDGFWGFCFAGLNDKGEMQIYDAEGNIIKPSSATTDDVVYQGTARPKTDMSLTNRFRYKDWELSFMFIAKLGHKYRKDCFSGSNIQNRHLSERWKQPGDEAHTIYPALKTWNDDLMYFPYIDKLIGNASYMKLRDVTLTYNVPNRVTKLVGMSDAKVYFQARNLFRVTSRGCDIDPETVEWNEGPSTSASTDQGYVSLPLPAEFYIGLSFSF